MPHLTSCGKSLTWTDLIQLNSVVKWGQQKDLTNGNIKSVTLMSVGTQRLCSLFLNKSALYTAPHAWMNEWMVGDTRALQRLVSTLMYPSCVMRAGGGGLGETTKSWIVNWNRRGHWLSAPSLIREVKGWCTTEGAGKGKGQLSDGKRGGYGASVTGDGALYPAPGMHRSSQSKLRFIYSGRAGINTQTCLATKWRTVTIQRNAWLGLDSFPSKKK